MRARKTRFRTSDWVAVVVCNKNPFQFTYELKLGPKTLEGTDLAGFFEKIGLSVKSPGEAAADGEPQPASARVDSFPDDSKAPLKPSSTKSMVLAAEPPCPPADAVTRLRTNWNSIVIRWEGKKGLRNRVDEAGKSVAAAIKTADSAAELLRATTATTAVIRKLAAAAITAIDASMPPATPAPEAQVKLSGELRTEAAAAGIVAAEFLKAYPGCRQTSWFFDVHQKAADLATQLDTADAALASIAEARRKLDVRRKAIEAVLASPSAFTDVQWLGPYDAPTSATVTLDRKTLEKDAKPERLTEATLGLGGRPVFSTGAGFSYSRLPKRSYVPVTVKTQGIVNGQPQTTTSTTVGLEEDSDNRLAPMLFLHTRLGEPAGAASWYFSFGATPVSTDGAIRPEFLFGVSVGFAKERLMFTAGAYQGWVETLDGSLQIRQAVADDVKVLPTRWGAVWRLGISASWRIK